MTFELFVRPVIRRLAGHDDVIGREIVRATLERSGAQGAQPARLHSRPTGRKTADDWRANLAGGQESHMLTALAAADGLAIIPETHGRCPAGTAGRGDPPAMTDPTRRNENERRERRRLTHVSRGGRPRMVDVSAKPATARRATAEAFVTLEQETISAIIDGQMTKGDVLTVAEMAGVMARQEDVRPHPAVPPHPDHGPRRRDHARAQSRAACASGPRRRRWPARASRWRR